MTQDKAPPSSRSETGRPGAGPIAAAPVVAFDFDGTLTVRDSFTAFLKWRAGAGFAPRLARLAPAALAYLIHRDRGRIKADAVRMFLRGVPRERLAADALAFAEAQWAGMMRPDALTTWRAWREKPVRLLIVSASPSFVVAPFAERLGADEVIATELAYDARGEATGAFATPNCRGPEKVVRLRARFGPEVRLEAAYGDTTGDREMLQIARTTGYRVFKATP
jgi:phosphatidylglycerophosphatase C